MALKTDIMNILIVSLLLQTTWAQQAMPTDNFYRLFNLLQQQSDPFSDSGQSNFNFAEAFPLTYDNLAEPPPYYQNAAKPLRDAQSDYYINGFPFAPFLPLNTLPLDPDLTLFLSFCNVRLIQKPINCNPLPIAVDRSPSTSSPSTIPPPATDQTSSPVSDSITSSPFSQTTPSSNTRPNPPPSTNAPTTRPTTQQPATTHQASGGANSTTEGPNIITIRIGDPDEEAPAATTEEQYLPLNFDIVKPNREPSVNAPPVLHVPEKKLN